MYTEETLRALGTPFEIQPETLAETERFDPETWSDIYKDAHGVRPRFGLGDKTAKQLDVLWDATINVLEYEIEVSKRLESVAFDTLHQDIANTRELGADGYALAIRWLMQAEGSYDIDDFLYSRGIESHENVQLIKRAYNA